MLVSWGGIAASRKLERQMLGILNPFIEGGTVVNCTAALLTRVGPGGKRKKGKVQKRSLDPIYTTQVGFTGDSIIWTRQRIDISNTPLVSKADTTGRLL